MKYYFQCVAIILATVSTASIVEADWEEFNRDRRLNRNWPHPFVQPDREAARAPFGVMIANGWRAQHTLGHEHFNADTGLLNEAGELKAREILDEAPPEHHTLFVLRTSDRHITAARIQSVEELAQRAADPGEAPAVVETRIRQRSWAAGDTNALRAKIESSRPAPILPTSKSSSGSSGGQ